MGRNAFCLERWSDGAEGIAAVGAVAARYSVLMNGNLTLKTSPILLRATARSNDYTLTTKTMR